MAIKCAAKKCRSGYRPRKNDYKETKKGETSDPRKSVFRFPKNKLLRDLWIKALGRDNFDANHTAFVKDTLIQTTLCQALNIAQ